ncbi:LOW QUALITY PROTEIN: multimodular transpeptidase-transglycosylase [Bacillus sp. JCM 19046]|nr:LOW QUALITY PROTEIN: multimodular transpeptidase-transglycosylase [Bacillus sp. JCM 19046]
MHHKKTRQKQRKTNRKLKKRGVLKKIALSLALIIGLGIIGGGIAVGVIIAGAPDIDKEQLTLPQSLQLHDMDDELAFTLSGTERRINADIGEMPPHLTNAFLAIEDHRFRDHFGVDVRRLGGAVLANIREGFGAEGGSTITQQLVKNLFLNDEKALSRKIQEAYLAIQLERRYSKDEILEMYLNQVNLGPSVGYGVQLASERYFGKDDLSDLTIADAAVLAAIPQRPAALDPNRNPENNQQRRNTVIDRMEREGFITADEAEEARNTDINDQINYVEEEDFQLVTFYDEVLTELEEMPELTRNDIYNSGLKVYTTLDMDAQNLVNDVLKSGEYSNLPFPDNEDFRAGVTLIDNNTGAIRALGNGTEENDARVQNFATIQRNQGSVMKPLLSYAPLIDSQQKPTAEIIVDEPYNYVEQPDRPVRNFDRQFQGPITMREALSRSRNVPAVKAMNEVGVENAYQFVDQMYEIGDGRTEAGILGPAISSTKDIAGSYAAFANGGQYTEPYTIRKIVFPDGRELDIQPETTQVMEDYTAYMITDMLKTAMTSGTGQAAQVPGVPIAGKTGTGNFGDEEIERYNIPQGGHLPFAGYSTNYSMSVWLGFDKNKEGNYLSSSEHGNIARHVFRHVMTGVHEAKLPTFQDPDSVEEKRVERSTGLLPSAGTPSSQIITELFVRGTVPESVSEQFAEIPDPSGLDYTYDEEAETLQFSWSYSSDFLDQVEFDTSISRGSLDVDEDNLTATVANVTPGSSYTFTVQARATDGTGVTSSSVSVTAQIEAVEEEEEEEEPIEEEPPPEEEEPVEEEPPTEGTDPDEGDSPDGSNGDENNGGSTDPDSGTDTQPDEEEPTEPTEPTEPEDPGDETDDGEANSQSNDED